MSKQSALEVTSTTSAAANLVGSAFTWASPEHETRVAGEALNTNAVQCAKEANNLFGSSGRQLGATILACLATLNSNHTSLVVFWES